MKRGIDKLLVFCLLLIFGGLFSSNHIWAASANVEITTDSSQVTVGDKVLVYINISSDAMFGDIEANLVYDEEILEYKGGVSFITGGIGFLRIADINISEGADNRKYALEFQAIKVGQTQIEFSGPVMVYDYETELPMSVFYDSTLIEVAPAYTASDNAYLSSLRTTPSELKPAFDKNIYEYSTSVTYDVERLVVVALPEDDNATIRIVGNDSLQEGENKVVVRVIAEAGNVIEYTINVDKEAAPEEIVDTSPITPDKKHGTLELVRIEGEIFAVYGGKYKVLDLPADIKVPNGYIKTKIIISGISIPVLSSEKLDDEFLLLYAQNELGEEGLYSYDKVEKTLQRYITKPIPEKEQTDELDKDLIDAKEYQSKLNIAAIIIALLCALCAVFLILCIRLFMKLRGLGDD